MSTFIPKLGDVVEFTRGKYTIVGTVEHVPTGEELWFRIRATEPIPGGLFEVQAFELRLHVKVDVHYTSDAVIQALKDNAPTSSYALANELADREIDDITRNNARAFVNGENQAAVIAWKHCSCRPCLYCDEVERLRVLRYPDTGPTLEECRNKFSQQPRVMIQSRINTADVTGHVLDNGQTWEHIQLPIDDTEETCWRCGKAIRYGMAGVDDHGEGCPGRASYRVKPRHMMTEGVRHAWDQAARPMSHIRDTAKLVDKHNAAEESAFNLLGDLMPEGVRFDSETPGRMARAFGDLLEGYGAKFGAILKTFPRGDADSGIVIVRDIPFASVCEHHVLPFTGTATVAYLPKLRIVGLSKIPRLVRAVTRRLQVQERIGSMIADALMEHVGAAGAMVVIKSRHTCMTLRGVESPGEMVTSCVRGTFAKDAPARAEVLSLMGTK